MEGFLITILMFSVPIVAAIIDKKLKAGRKAQPLVHAEPIIFEDEEEEEEEYYSYYSGCESEEDNEDSDKK